MITEAQALAALPDRGWLRRYVEHGASITDCHLGFHIVAGLAVLSQSVPISYLIPDGYIRANVYGLIVGESTESRKTTAVNIAERVLKLAKPEAVMSNVGSEQRLVDSIVENPQQLLFIGEGGSFLGQMESGYLRNMKERLAEIYDCRRLARETVKGKKISQDDPRLSLLIGIADSFLEAHTEDADWTGGFLARFFTIYGKRERTRRRAGSNEQEEVQLAEELKRLLPFQSGDAFGPRMSGVCLGLDEGADKLWGEWFDQTSKINAARTVKSAVGRSQGMALKIAGLLAWDFGMARTGSDWYITEEVLRPALAITDLHISSVLTIGETISTDRDMRILRRVLQTIGPDPTPVSAIYRNAQVTQRIGDEMIKTLMTHKRIELASSGESERSFRRIDGNGVVEIGSKAPLRVVSGAGDPFADDAPKLKASDLFG